MTRHRSSSLLRRLVVRGSVSALAAAGLVLGVTPTAHAAGQFACTGGGAVTIDKQLNGTYRWALTGVAVCNNPDGGQVRQVALTGLGQTAGLGVCSGDNLIAPFALNVALTYDLPTPLGTTSFVQHEVWSFPATTFPVVTAFTVGDQTGGTFGAGELSTHIAGKCPPLGEPSMQVAWVQAT